MNEPGAFAPRKLASAGPSNWNPVLSPDGSKILFFSDRNGKGRDQIFVVNAGGFAETELTKGACNNTFPSWSRDGARIIFGSNREGTGREMPAEFARWSPDGKRLACISGTFPEHTDLRR